MTTITDASYSSIAAASYSSIAAAFGGIAIYTAISSLNYEDEEKQEKHISKLSSLILFIAFYHYTKLSDPNLNEKQRKLIRYSDWIITVPLLILELFLINDWVFVGEDGKIDLGTIDSTLPICLILSILMVVFGYISKSASLCDWWFVASCICLILIGVIIGNKYKNDYDDEETISWWQVPAIFFVLWVVYPILFGFDKNGTNVEIWYNLLDFITKGVFALVITNHI